MTQWPVYSLGSKVKFLSGGTPSKEELRYWGGEIPWVSSAEMVQRRIRDTALRVTEDGARDGSRLIPSRTILVVVRGMSLAKEFRVAITERELAFNQDLKALVPSCGLDPTFLFYYLLSQSNAIRDSASEAAHGTKKLDMPVLEQWPIPVPPMATQKNIASILSAYDDLIENNRRRIALLEKMAEEIYREWFVRMRFPGHEQAKFEKGVPVGWEIKTVRDLVEFYIGGGWGEESQSAIHPEGAYVIRGTDIPSLNEGDWSASVFRYHSVSNLKSRRLMAGDFVFETSGGSKDQLLGRNMMVTEGLLKHFSYDVLCASFCKLIRFREASISSYFMKYFLKQYYESGLVGLFQVQSTGISNYQFESFLTYQQVIVPSQKAQSAFEKAVKPLLDLRDILAAELLVLKDGKTALLPRLISGKLPVEHLDIRFPPSMLESGNGVPEAAPS